MPVAKPNTAYPKPYMPVGPYTRTKIQVHTRGHLTKVPQKKKFWSPPVSLIIMIHKNTTLTPKQCLRAL